MMLERSCPRRGAHRARDRRAVLAGAWARWGAPAIGFWLMSVPFLFSTTNAAAYLTDTLVGDADLWLCGLRYRPSPASRRSPPPPGRRCRRAGATIRRPGRSACPSSSWRSSASTSRATSPPISSVTSPTYGSRSSPARPPIRRTAPRRSSPAMGAEAWPVSDAAVGRLHLSPRDPHRHRRLAAPLAHDAVAGRSCSA